MTIIHDPNGKVEFKLRAANGKQCMIGVQANGSSMSCGAKGIKGWFSPEGGSGVTSE